MYTDTSLVFSLRYKIILVFIIHELDFNFLFQQNSENHTRTKKCAVWGFVLGCERGRTVTIVID